MNGFLKTTVAGLCLGTGLASMVGCHTYRQLVDPCWPERYNAEARHNVRDTFAAQAHNGHILDQTVWNHHFETDSKTGGPTEKLTPGGMEHLKYLARRRPVPDPHLFLQTANDIPGAGALPADKLALARADLDSRRVAAIQRFMTGVMTSRNEMVEFSVAIHDPGDVGLPATPITGNLKNPPIRGSVPLLFDNFKGKMEERSGSLQGAGGGATGGGGQ